jgi:EAL domain-containing protein (putative c-di-GMP-specific phosphodiesterase class I)
MMLGRQAVEESGIVYSQGYYWGRPMPSTSLLDSSIDVNLQHSTPHM